MGEETTNTESDNIPAGLVIKTEPVGRTSSPVYTANGMSEELCQGEIVTELAQYDYDLSTFRVKETRHRFAIVLSQDCDLAQAYGKPDEINHILIYRAFVAEEIRSEQSISSRDWDRIVKNSNDRYQYLESIPREADLQGEGLPALVLDFKFFFGIPSEQIYRQIDTMHGARRRSRLESPYKEHLQSRAAFYLQRVMLPLTHRKG